MRNLANQGMDRSAVNSIPRQFISHGSGDEPQVVLDKKGMYEYLVANGLLRRDETREIEDSVTMVADRDRVGVQDLIDNGLVRNLRNIGVTMYQVDRHGAVADGHQSMSIEDLSDRDRIAYTPELFPVPVTSSQFRLDRRYIEAGRTQGQGVDVSNVEEHTRACLRRLEDTLVNGNSNIVMTINSTQYTLQGYTNLSARQQVSLNDVGWDSTSDLTNAVQDVLDAKSTLANDGYTGPYMVYVPENWDKVLDDDYKSESDRTLRERLLAITGVEDVKVLASLSDDNAVVVQMTRSVVEYAVGQELGPVTWDVMGGLAQRWAIIEVSTFAMKTAEDEDGTSVSGIAHIS